MLPDIHVPLQAYFQGHATGEAAWMREAFSPFARIVGIREGKPASLTLDEFCGLFGGSPAEDEATRRRTIDSIESAGNVGCARLTLVHGPITFSDWMLLLEIGGAWKIVSKVYSSRPTT
jgi:3-hydroxyisobutyrate dehydrogenase